MIGVPARPIPVSDFTGAIILAVALVSFLSYLNHFAETPGSTPVRFNDTGTFTPASPEALSGYQGNGGTTKILFVGDIMQHARQAQDDFQASYAPIAPLLGAADLAVGNLEFPVVPDLPVGPVGNSVRFNGSPAHLDAIRAAGFDLLSMANNHLFDQGLGGAESTIRALRARELMPVGSAMSGQPVEPVVREVDGIRMAFSGYTFRPNVYPVKNGQFDYWAKDWPVVELNFDDWTGEYRAKGLAQFRKDIAKARGAGAEFLVALVHWGKEWHLQPTEDQRRAAHDLIDAGFDLVVGGHSHVINGPEVYRGRLISYSLGNFISDFSELPTRVGGILEVSVDRRRTGDMPRLVDFRYYATLLDRNGHRIVPITGDRSVEENEAWALASRIFGPALRPITAVTGE